ncbi:hypothetical protein B0H13DRAFT_2316098 [Mycena leptocephala]|nr:hypothetical protein B0H13DRAFT_2316098 [Mycena leptocephala]
MLAIVAFVFWRHASRTLLAISLMSSTNQNIESPPLAPIFVTQDQVLQMKRDNNGRKSDIPWLCLARSLSIRTISPSPSRFRCRLKQMPPEEQEPFKARARELAHGTARHSGFRTRKRCATANRNIIMLLLKTTRSAT